MGVHIRSTFKIFSAEEEDSVPLLRVPTDEMGIGYGAISRANFRRSLDESILGDNLGFEPSSPNNGLDPTLLPSLGTNESLPRAGITPNGFQKATATKRGQGQKKKAQIGVILTWTDLSVSVDAGKGQWQLILDRVNGKAEPGEVMAIMGCSGAGKSTMLNALAGQLQSKQYRVEGNIAAKHTGMAHNISKKTTFGYVHQEEVFIPTLTVEEQLKFIAFLRLRGLSSADRAIRVEEQISRMGLGKCRKTQIMSTLKKKGISGGEKKRLAFACSTIHNPLLLLADEPTTGLDSSSAQEVISAMSKMSGTTVICTIHQPASEIFFMFDKLLLLAEGGMVAYFGSPRDSLKFFSGMGIECPLNFNPADLYIKAIAVDPHNDASSRVVIRSICQAYKERSYHQRTMDGVKDWWSVKHVLEMGGKQNPITEIFWITRWVLLDSFRDKSAHLHRILQRVFVAITMALLYANTDLGNLDQTTIKNVNGIFFLFLCECIFPIEYGYIHYFPKDMPISRREVGDGLYRPTSYYISKVLASIPIIFIDVALVTSIFYFVVGLGGFPDYCFTTSIAILCSCISAGFGTLLSLCFSNVSNSATTAGAVNMILFCFSGFYMNFSSLPYWLNWLRYLDWFSYSFVLLLTWHWSGVDHISCDFPEGDGCLLNGGDVLDSYAMPRSKTIALTDIIALVSLFFIFNSLALGLYLMRIKRMT